MLTVLTNGGDLLEIPNLTYEELEVIKASLLNFVIRVSGNGEDRLPEEIQVLPATIDMLFRFSD